MRNSQSWAHAWGSLGGLVETQITEPCARASDQYVWGGGGGREFAFPINSQGMLMLLIQGHFENFYSDTKGPSQKQDLQEAMLLVLVGGTLSCCSGRPRYWLTVPCSCEGVGRDQYVRWQFWGSWNQVKWLIVLPRFVWFSFSQYDEQFLGLSEVIVEDLTLEDHKHTIWKVLVYSLLSKYIISATSCKTLW